jgi:hypothetical protein
MHEIENRGGSKMKKSAIWLAALCACALLLAGVAINAAPQSNSNVAGAWTITMAPPAGGGGGGTPPASPTVTFKQDGSKLSGTQSGRGGDTAIDGSVSGNNVTWSLKRTGGDGNEVTITYNAIVDGDAMKGTSTSSMANATPRDFTATRKK